MIDNLPFEMRFLEGRNLYIKPVPLDTVWEDRDKHGSLNYRSYREEFNLFRENPKNYLGLVVNGIFYAAETNSINSIKADYDRISRTLSVHNFPILKEDDKACALIGKPCSPREKINTVVAEIKNFNSALASVSEMRKLYGDGSLVLFGDQDTVLAFVISDEFEDPEGQGYVYVTDPEQQDYERQVPIQDPSMAADCISIFDEDGEMYASIQMQPQEGMEEQLGTSEFGLYVDSDLERELRATRVVGDKSDMEVGLYVCEVDEDGAEPTWYFIDIEELYNPGDRESIFVEKDGEKVMQLGTFAEGEALPDVGYSYYYIPELHIHEFIGLNINGVLYCHPDQVEYRKDISMLVVKSLEIRDSDIVYIVYNIKQNKRKTKWEFAREDTDRFPVIAYEKESENG